MNKWKYLFMLLLAIWLISLLGAYVVGQSKREAKFLTRMEVQQMLCRMGYPVEVDGYIGKESNAAWGLAEGDEFYKLYNTESGAPK